MRYPYVHFSAIVLTTTLSLGAAQSAQADSGPMGFGEQGCTQHDQCITTGACAVAFNQTQGTCVRARVNISSPSHGDVVGAQVDLAGGAPEDVLVMLDVRNAQGDQVSVAHVRAGTQGWSAQVTGLATGSYSVTARVEASGGDMTDMLSFDVDAQAPPLSVSAPQDLDILASDRIELAGLSEAGALIECSIKDDMGQTMSVAQFFADTNGDFTMRSEALPDGLYHVNVAARDAAQNTTRLSTLSISLDSVLPVTRTLSPQQGAVLRDALTRITGEGEGGSNVLVSVRHASGFLVMQDAVTVEHDGQWSLPVEGVVLTDGAYSIDVLATDRAGNTYTEQSTFEVLNTPATLSVMSPQSGAILDHGGYRFRGQTEPNHAVVALVHRQGKAVAQAYSVSSSQGAWSIALEETLADGAYTVDLHTFSEHGQHTEHPSVSFEVDSMAPRMEGLSPSAFARVADTTPVVSFITEPMARVEVRVDGRLEAEGQADERGLFQQEITRELATGPRTFEVRAQDRAGHVSDSGRYEVTLRHATRQATLARLDVQASDVVLTGEATPESVLHVHIGMIGRNVSVDEDGQWSARLENLPAGDHTLTVDGSGEPVTRLVRIEDAVQFSTSSGASLGCSTPAGSNPSLGFFGLLLMMAAGLLHRREKNHAQVEA